MILISAALVLAAIVLLIAGVVLAKPFLVMWSIVISVLSAVCLLIGALLRRHDLFPAGGRAADGPAQPVTGTAVPQMAHAGAPAFSGAPAHSAATPMPAAPPLTHPGMPGPQAFPQQAFPQQAFPQQRIQPARRPQQPVATSGRGLGPDSIVLVIPGRKRLHLANCRQLAGREVEELTYEEAREEGFTPCTTCLPEASPRPPEPETPARRPDGRGAAPAAVETFPATGIGADRPNAVKEAKSARNTEPVEPAETAAPGRAGSGVAADSTTVSTSGSTSGDDAAPTTRVPSVFDVARKPESGVRDRTAEAARPGPRPGTVKVLVGTRRFHGADCPLISGADPAGIETMTQAEAEGAGLTHCSVCQDA